MSTTKKRVVLESKAKPKNIKRISRQHKARQAKASSNPEYEAMLKAKRERARQKRVLKDNAIARGDTSIFDADGNVRDDVEISATDVHKLKWRVTVESIKKAQTSGEMPHEFLLKVMRGEPIAHPCRDIETDEIVTMLMIPNMEQRVEAAKAAAPYYAAKQAPTKIGGGKDKDPSKQAGVMEVPLASSMEQWAGIAGPAQAKLKKDVVK